MLFGFLEADFLSFVRVVVWFLIPLYGSFLGLSLPIFTKGPSLGALKGKLGENLGAEIYHTQLILFFGGLVSMATYRGHADWAFQGQIILAYPNVKLLFLVLFGLTCPLLTSTINGFGSIRTGSLGFSIWHLGPTLAVIWSFLPLTTQLTTSLLVLELVGVVLVWALTNVVPNSSFSPQRGQRDTSAAPGLVYALVIFVWASGISALSLLIGVGLVALEGGMLNFMGPLSLGNLEKPSIGGGEALFVFVLLFKFLMGGGQFLLLAWYRFLPTNGLVFYLFFYYPAHLIIGTTFFLGAVIGPLSSTLGAMIATILVATVCLLPHLGAQTSPALTLAGSSFIGLSFLALSILNLAI